MDKIRPQDWDWSEEIAKAKLRDLNYDVIVSPTYHTLLKTEFKQIIGRINNPTSIYIRTFPDHLAINKFKKRIFLLEIKGRKRPNVAIEAFPFILLKLLWDFLHVESYYMIIDEQNRDYTERIDKIKNPSKIFIPDRWTEQTRKNFKDLFQGILPDCEMVLGEHNKGSRDPWFLIAELEVNNWKGIKDILLTT